METSEEFFGGCDEFGGTLFEKFENGMTGTLMDGLSAKQQFGPLTRKANVIQEI